MKTSERVLYAVCIVLLFAWCASLTQEANDFGRQIKTNEYALQAAQARLAALERIPLMPEQAAFLERERAAIEKQQRFEREREWQIQQLQKQAHDEMQRVLDTANAPH